MLVNIKLLQRHCLIYFENNDATLYEKLALLSILFILSEAHFTHHVLVYLFNSIHIKQFQPKPLRFSQIFAPPGLVVSPIFEILPDP